MHARGKISKIGSLMRSNLRYAFAKRKNGWRFFLKNLTSLSLDYVEVSITKDCTLKCHACRHLMPYYVKPKNYDINNVIRDVNILLSSVNNITMLRILGGEPFLHKDLASLVDFVSTFANVGSLHIVTNGTLVPKEDVLTALHKAKAIIDISDYGIFSNKVDGLVDALKKYDVKYNIVKQQWYDFGQAITRPYSQQKLSDIFFNCTLKEHKCYIVSDGMFHICARSANAAELGIIMLRKADYVDLVNTPISKIAGKIRKLILFSDYVEACRTCVDNFNVIKSAEQNGK